MTSKNAVEKVMKILGLKSINFYEAKTEQGIEVKIDGDLELGAPIYVSTQEGMIPAPDGVHKLDDGSEIEVSDGKISKIKMGDVEEEIEETEEDTIEEMSEIELEFGDVKLVDGSVIRMEGDPQIGARVKKVGYDGALSAVVDGDYETVGGMVITIVGGSIQGMQPKEEYQKRKEGGNEPTPAETKEMEISAEQMAEMFAQALKKLEDKIDSIASKQNTLESNFQKFSKEPAGTKVSIKKTINETTPTNDKLEGFRRLRQSLNRD